MKRKSIMVDEDLHTKIKLEATKQKKSIEQFVKEILKSEISHPLRKFKRLKEV